MAGSKSSLTGEDFYGAYDAQETARAHAKELGMDIVPSLNITYTQVRPKADPAGRCALSGGGWACSQPPLTSTLNPKP